MKLRSNIRVMARCCAVKAFLVVFAIFFAGISAAGDSGVDLIPLEVFSAAHGYRNASLSPDGQYVALLGMADDQPNVRIIRIEAGAVSVVAGFEFPQSQIGRMVWITPADLLVSQTVTPVEIKPGSVLQRRLVRIDIENRRASEVLSFGLNRLMANAPGSILRVLDDVSGDVLVAIPPDGGFFPSVQVLNIFNGETTLLEPSSSGITTWLTDWDGRVRLATGIDRKARSIVRYREPDGSSWVDLSESRVFSDGNFLPIAFSRSGRSLYMRSALGRARDGLYEFDFDKERITRKIYGHPKYDIGTVFLANFDREIAGVSYIDDYFQVDYLSDSLKEILTGIDRHLPEAINVILQWSSDKDVFLVLSEQIPFPARYYIFQVAGDRMTELSYGGAEISRYPLVVPERVTYYSSDGLEIPAYLTRSKRQQEQPAPTVILPHGGPWVRDYITFNDWAQFFANRGYVVFQPNFRGSSGYGTLFQRRGYGEWGEAMQRDLEDGVHWLIDQGIADPERICIAGGSYGGYAALMASIESPELFQCAIAYAPVTSLSKFANSFGKSPYRKSLQSAIRGEDNKAPIRSNSPVRRGKDVAIPLLLVHGTSDIRVPVSHSRDMMRALRKSRTDVTYLELAGESHFLYRPSARLAVFGAMEKHLQQYLAAD